MKSVRSWSKPDGIDKLIAIKSVDLSLFKYGTHIPLKFHEDFEKANLNQKILRGEKHDVIIIIKGESYEATLININRTQIDIDTLQLRWDNNTKLKQKLEAEFSASFNYLKRISSNEIEEGLNKNLKIPKELFEYIEFYDTGTPFQYEIKTVPTKLSKEEINKLFKENTPDESTQNYWIFQCNLKIFNVIEALKNNQLKSWSVSSHKEKIKNGDKFILWVVGKEAGCYSLGTITSDIYEGKDDIVDLKYSKKPDGNKITRRCNLIPEVILVNNPIERDEIISNEILKDLNVGYQGTIFAATKVQYEELNKIALEHMQEEILSKPLNKAYKIDDLVNDTGISKKELERWIRAIKRKKQAIFYGPPGTGKTYISELIARHLIADTDGFADLIQFHPAYSYEDFIQGIRPKITDSGILYYPLTLQRYLIKY
jgi:hypothetical protein